MRIIPAIDILNGKCVRLTRGDYNSVRVYDESPLEVAKSFEGYGFRYLHLIDLDGAKERQIVNRKILEDIASETSLIIDFGGGMKSEGDIRMAFESGASQVTVGTVAATSPLLFEEWLSLFGPERIILGADAENRKIKISAWTEETLHDVVDYIEGFCKKGLLYAACTDISKDGMLVGPSLSLYREILARTSVRLIASGGISAADQIRQLDEAGCEGAIIGKAIYEGTVDIKELSGLC